MYDAKHTPDPQNEQEKELWRLAKKRVKFRRHLATYVIINAMLWILWWLGDKEVNDSHIPWPAYSTFGWGIGLAFNFMGAYGFTRNNSVEREYEKLKSKR